MHHLQVLVPADLTRAVVATLVDARAVSGLVVDEGTALKPAGGLILADVAGEVTNDAIDRPRELGCTGWQLARGAVPT